MPRGRALKPLEKAGQVGLGNEQTETELYLYKIAASISTFYTTIVPKR